MDTAIEFQLWDQEQKKMFGQEDCRQRSSMAELYGLVALAIRKEDLGQSSPYIMLPYTGRKDHNGKKLFAGDLITTHYLQDHFLWVVVWDPAVLQWYANPIYGINSRPAHLAGFWDMGISRVIKKGNVYTHPELLTEQLHG